MADSNYNIIKPVEGLQNIGRLTPAKRRQQKKKKQNMHQQEKQQRQLVEDEIDETFEENVNDTVTGDNQQQDSIDYRA